MTSDYQRVVEYLRDLRQAPLQVVNDEITQAAAEYAALCAEANERLRKASAFLQQGLRTEAIHLADDPPNLLDLVAALDLPEPQVWTEFCQNNGLAVAPPLQMDRASQLNEAYALDQPLEHLLSRHRYLALSRAPVRERLDVLRRIAQIDAGGAAWEKDIRVFEKARLRELPSAFYSAVKTRDEAGISSLMTELTQNPWYEAVPQDLTTAVSDAFTRMQRAACEAELKKMVEPLRDAYAAQSLKECQALAQRWKKVMANYGVTRLAADLEDEIKPVVAFINETEKREEYLKRFRDSCKAFGKMLDHDAGDSELEAGYAKLKEFKEPIPEELTGRYTEKKRLREKAVNRSHKARLLAIGAGVAGVVVVVLVAGGLMLQANSARGWSNKIRQANNARDLGLAEKYIAALRKDHPGYLTDHDVETAIKETEDLQAKYNNLSVIRAGLLEQVEAADKDSSAVAANPKASLDDMLASAANLQAMLDTAQKDGDLSWADTHNELAKELVRVQELLTGLRTRVATAVRQEVDEESTQLDGLAMTPAAASQSSDALNRISNRLSILKGAAGVDDDTKAAVTALAAKLDQRRQALDVVRGVAGELDAVRQATGSSDELKKALTAFVGQFPNDSRTADFTEAIARTNLEKGVEAWRDVVSQWNKTFAPGTSAMAQRRIDLIAGYATAYPDSPMTAAASAYSDYCRRAVDALAEKSTWQNTLGDMLANPLMSELSYMETSDHVKYYVVGDIDLHERKMNDQVSVTFQAVDPEHTDKRISVSVDAPTTVSAKPILTPHAVLAAQLMEEIKRIDENNWETWGIDLIEKLKKDETIDVVTRAVLVQQAIKGEDAVAGWALEDTYAKAAAELAREKPEELPWLDPAKISAGTRKSLKEILDGIPAATAIRQTLDTKKAALFKAAAFDVAATGVLTKDEAGKWVISNTSTVGNGNVAWVVVPGGAAAPGGAPLPPAAPVAPPAAPAAPASAPAAGAAGPAPDPAAPPAPAPVAAPGAAAPGNPGTLVQIGVYADGKMAINEAAMRGVVQGSMVYFTRP